jgi:hypothetical protein
MLRTIIRLKLKGGALYITIMISLIITITFLMMLILGYYNKTNISQFLIANQIELNIKSGFEIAHSIGYNENLNDKYILLHSTEDSIKINKKQWGLYHCISVSAKHKKYSLEESGLFGTFMSSDTGLVTIGKDKTTTIAGKCDIKAYCYLPKGEIKFGTIDDSNGYDTKDIKPFIKNAPAKLPEIDSKLIDNLINLRDQIRLSDSIINEPNESLKWPFSKKTITIILSTKRLRNANLTGNIKLYSKNDLEIDSNCSLDNVLIIAKKVKFLSGFKGKVHVLAEDSIICSNNTIFDYPTSFTVYTDEINKKRNSGIILGSNTELAGCIFSYKEHNDEANGSFIKLNSKSKIKGLVYTNGYLHLEGEMMSNIYTSKLLIKTSSSVYENHLLSCSINPKKSSNIVYIPNIFKQSKAKVCLCDKL